MIGKVQECIAGKYENHTAPFLWLHWEEDSLILDELDRIYESGVRAVCVESRTHEDFCREGWWEDMRLILDRCCELDMKVWILDDKHFPSGYGNGIFKKKEYKHLRFREITESHIDLSGPKKDAGIMLEFMREFKTDKILAAVLCRRDENSDDEYDLLGSIDVTDCIDGDTLRIDVPEGYWRLVVLLETKQRKNYYGDYVDIINPEATDVLIEEVFESHYRELGEYFGNTFIGFFSDEPGFHNNQEKKLITDLGKKYTNYPWNDFVKDELYKRYGDDMWKKLVNIFFKTEGEYAEARTTYMDVITRLYNDSYSAKLADWCHRHGVMYIGHIIEDLNACSKTGSTAGNYFRALEGQDMSGIDIVLSQVLPGMDDISHTRGPCETGYTDYRFYRYSLAKLASSMANTNERMNGRAMCEIFGAFGWVEGTKTMKWLTDFMLVRGINYYVPHAFSPKENDKDCPPNFYARGQNPQFKFFRRIMEYMNKCSDLLVEGRPVRSCGVLHDTEARWSGGALLEADRVAEQLLNNQIDFDYICNDYLLKATAQNGKVQVGQSEYGVIVVPYFEYMSIETISKLVELEGAGVKVIWVDSMPKYSLEAAEVKIKGEKVVPLEKLVAYMYKKGMYDIKLSTSNKKIKFNHRKSEKNDLYMFVNEDVNNTVDLKVRLKGFKGGSYAVYDVLENKIYSAHSADGYVELSIPTYGSLMVVTGDESGKFPQKECAEKELVKEFFDYDLSLAEEGKEYESYKHLDEPMNVTGKNGKKKFSGHMRYEGKLNIEDAGRYELDFGNVGETLELYINGKPVGEKICPPYTFDITDKVSVGENELLAIVANTLVFKERDATSRVFPMEPSGLLDKTKLYRKK